MINYNTINSPSTVIAHMNNEHLMHLVFLPVKKIMSTDYIFGIINEPVYIMNYCIMLVYFVAIYCSFKNKDLIFTMSITRQFKQKIVDKAIYKMSSGRAYFF